MRIRWTDAAVHDLTAICDYIQEQSTSETARRVAFSMYAASMAVLFLHRNHAAVSDFANCVLKLDGGVIDAEVMVQAFLHVAQDAFAD
jgi:hypothetical protein